MNFGAPVTARNGADAGPSAGAAVGHRSRALPRRLRATSFVGEATIRRDLFHLLAVSAVTMGLAQTIAKEKIFAPLRERLGGKETWLGYLFSCPYCASHWLAFALVPLTGSYYVDVAVRQPLVAAVLTWFLSSILVVVIAAFMRVGFWFVDESQGLVRRQQRTEEERAAIERATRERLETDEEARWQ